MEQTLSNRVLNFINEVEQLEINQKAALKSKESLENQLNNLVNKKNIAVENLDIAANAVTILRTISDDAVQQSYEFIQDSLNTALERIFEKTTRKIKLKESTFKGQYPQLEIELTVENGIKRSLKSDSGHGLMQIVSLLCVLSLIVITNSRRFLVIDEVLSGLSGKSRKVVDDILWTFTEIGFQFVVNEHGFVPKGSKVIYLEMNSGVSSVANEYIAEEGVYLMGDKFEDMIPKTGEEIVEATMRMYTESVGEE